MTKRLFLVAASVAALCACNSRSGNADANRSASANSSGTASAPAAPAAPAGTGAAGGAARDPQLEQQMAQAVEALRPQLPIRQQTPGGTLTISNIEAHGSELIYTMEVPTDLNATSFQAFEQALPQQACANPQARQLFERGGAYTYHLRDAGGEEFSTTIRGC